MTSESWEDQLTCKWTQEGQLDIRGLPTDMPTCLQFYLISVSRSNKWPRALQLIQEEEGHCFISGTGISFPLDYESSSSEEDDPSRGPLPEDEVEFFSGKFPKDRVKKSVFLRTVEKCVEERRKTCGPLDDEDQFLNHVRKQTKPQYAADRELAPGSSGIKRSASVDSQTGLLTPPKQSSTSHRLLSSLDLACTCTHDDSSFADWITYPETKHLGIRIRKQTEKLERSEKKYEISRHQVDLQEGMVRSLQKEVVRLTQEQETAQRFIQDYKREIEDSAAHNKSILKEAIDDVRFQKAITVDEELKVRTPAWGEEHSETKQPASNKSSEGTSNTVLDLPSSPISPHSSEEITQRESRQAIEKKSEDITRTEIIGDYDPQHSAARKTMADESDFDEVIDLTDKAQVSVSQNIGKLQQLIVHSGEFKKVAKFFDKAPEWSTAEGRAFFEMMEHIKYACDSYGQVLGGARRYVISAKAFAKDTVNFTTDVQEEPDDIEDIFVDFIDSIKKMKESNKQVETLKEEFRSVLMRLRDAQTKAAGGKVRGKENAAEADTNTGYGVLGTIGAGVATVMTVGLAAQFLLVGYGYTWKSMKDAEKCREWEENFNFVLHRLDELYSILDSITNECTNALDQLSKSSSDIMDKSKRMTAKKKPITSGHLKRKCIRLAEESANLERTCIEYIRKDNEIRGIAGAMNRLSLE